MNKWLVIQIWNNGGWQDYAIYTFREYTDDFIREKVKDLYNWRIIQRTEILIDKKNLPKLVY